MIEKAPGVRRAHHRGGTLPSISRRNASPLIEDSDGSARGLRSIRRQAKSSFHQCFLRRTGSCAVGKRAGYGEKRVFFHIALLTYSNWNPYNRKSQGSHHPPCASIHHLIQPAADVFSNSPPFRAWNKASWNPNNHEQKDYSYTRRRPPGVLAHRERHGFGINDITQIPIKRHEYIDIDAGVGQDVPAE